MFVTLAAHSRSRLYFRQSATRVVDEAPTSPVTVGLIPHFQLPFAIPVRGSETIMVHFRIGSTYGQDWPNRTDLAENAWVPHNKLGLLRTRERVPPIMVIDQPEK